MTTIAADERRLKQVLVNLLSNAVKFTPEGGKIGLEVASDAVHAAVHFIVWDTGIAQQDLPRHFQPFVQLDSSLARNYTGTGLGLALVRRMVEMQGGMVAIESEVGKGSRFTVTLPWKELAPASASAADAAPGATASLLPSSDPHRDVASGQARPAPVILLAEDNQDNIEMLSAYLEATGYHIVVARNGIEALKRAREVRPAVILMDIQMPEMDGLEATRRMRADAELGAIPIIALTALAMDGDRERCLEAGAHGYLSKPVSLQELATVLETHLQAQQT